MPWRFWRFVVTACICPVITGSVDFDVHLMFQSAVGAAATKSPVSPQCHWRQTGGCDPHGDRETEKDHSCSTSIGKGASGFCDCDGDGEWDDGEKGFKCGEAPAGCAALCPLHGHPKVIPVDEADRVTPACVPDEAREAFKSAFQASVDVMLSKTKRSMSKGLTDMARAFKELIQSTTCGKLRAAEKFVEQANRLSVLASVRGLGNLDSKVKYEPLKTLSVGGVDIHSELNGLIIAWQLKKGPEETGRAMMEFLWEFEEDEGDDEATVAPAPTITHAPAPGAGSREVDRNGAEYWRTALNRGFQKLHYEDNDAISAACVAGEAAAAMGAVVEQAFSTMMEKNRRSMQRGLRALAEGVTEFLDRTEASCPGLETRRGPQKLRAAAARMKVLASTKSLMNFGVHIEYEPMKNLVVGGVDVHAELNSFILAWINNRGAASVGEAMAAFFEDFQGEEEPEEPREEEPAQDDPMVQFATEALWHAGLPAGGFSSSDGSFLPNRCLQRGDRRLADFEAGIAEALEHMLKKRMKTMQQGLKELADATDRFLDSLDEGCAETEGGKKMQRAAKKVMKLTRRTVVDYGTHIKYEAMKSLRVANVPIHVELNNFISAWKLRSISEAGKPFGDLMKKLATIDGHDEL